jgi:EAL and modified HD-GYP domain-containing signal transduction protein
MPLAPNPAAETAHTSAPSSGRAGAIGAATGRSIALVVIRRHGIGFAGSRSASGVPTSRTGMFKLFSRRQPAPPPPVAPPAPPAPPAREIAILYAAADGILATDAAGRVTLANPAAAAAVGRAELEVLGRSLEELLRPVAPDGDEGPVTATLRDGAARRASCEGDIEASLARLPDGGVVAVLRELAAAKAVEEETSHAPAEVAVVRRPVTDEAGEVVGYELVVVDDDRDAAETAKATAALLLDVSEDAALAQLAGRHRAWLPVTASFLRDVGTPPLRPDRVVLQLAAEPVAEDVLAALGRLRWSGYELALTGYDGAADAATLLEHCTFATVAVSGRDDDELRALIAEPVQLGVRLVATGVATAAELERCRGLGFALFQGEFFAKPGLERRRRVGTAGGSLQTLAEVTAPDASFEDLERTISADVGLSVKLLRYVNSAYFGLPRTVESVREALTMLGTATVRRWATVMALGAAGDAPPELVDLALQRARMCEILGGGTESDTADAMFTVGLFSVADALLNSPMAEVLETLPFSDEIRTALLNREGRKGELLDAVLAYERGDATPEVTPDAYRAGVEFAGEVGAAVAA